MEHQAALEELRKSSTSSGSSASSSGSSRGGGSGKNAARATVSEECPKCKNPTLEFYTMQLRSADEGQTVFYECPKCRHTFSENN